MTNEQISKLMEEHFHLCPIHDNYYVDWSGETDDYFEFAKQIRKKTLEEVISILEEIPIADTYREAIYRTIKTLDL